MPSKYLPLLVLACAPLAHADEPSTARNTTTVQTLSSGSNTAKADELDAISAEIAAKFAAQAPATAYDVLLARIGKLQLATLRGGMGQDPDSVRAYGLQQFIASLQDYLLQKDKSPESANASLQQLIGLSASIPVIPRTTLLAMTVKPEDSNAARIKKANDLLAALTDKVVATIDKAKDPADLDTIFAEIATASNNRNDYRDNSSRLQNLKYFVQNWQDYLAALKDNRITDAHNDLKGLVNPNYDASFYPRSKILAAESALPPAPPPAILHLAKPEQVTLDTLDSFLGQIAALRTNPQFIAGGETGLEQAVVNLRQAYIQVKTGRGREVLTAQAQAYNPYGLGRYTDAMAQLWLQVRLLAAPDAIEAPATAPKPTDKDTMNSYLERSLVSAIASKDWVQAARILKVEQVVVPQLSNEAGDDLIGIHALVVGTNYETAGQWASAVASYTSALTSTGPHIPIKELSSRLHSIDKAHPEEYAAGLKLPDPALQQQMNAYRPRPGMPNGPVGLPNGQVIMPNGQTFNR